MLNLIQKIDQELLTSHQPQPTFIFPEYQDARVLQAAAQLLSYIKILLPATRDEIYKIIEENSISLSLPVDEFLASIACIELAKQGEIKKLFAKTLTEISQGKKWQYHQKDATLAMEHPLNFSIMAVRHGFCNAILGGILHASKDYFTPCLRFLKKEKTVFELGLFVLPDEHPAGIFRENLVVFSDVAINLTPDAETLANIAVGTCQIVRDIVPESILPEVNGTILSYSTKGSGSGPMVDVVRGAGDLIPAKLQELCAQDKRYRTINIDWEMQMSVALSEKAARTKIKDYEKSPVAGRANVLTVTNLDFGNSLYHLYATTWPTSLKLLQVGGIFGQALDFSRSSSAEDVVVAAKALALQHLKRQDFCGTSDSF